MSSEIFQVDAAINSVRTLVDRGVKLDVVTRELSPEDYAKLFSLKGKEGVFLFKETDILPEEVPDIVDVEFEKKPRTERLNGKLWHVWNNGAKTTPWEVYRAKFWDQIENKLDQQLD